MEEVDKIIILTLVNVVKWYDCCLYTYFNVHIGRCNTAVSYDAAI